MPFLPGALVHFAGLGTGVVRQVRRHDRYLVEIKGRAVVASGAQLTPADARKGSGEHRAGHPPPARHAGDALTDIGASLDLHGLTVAESVDVLKTFVNEALLAGRHRIVVVHGRSGGRVKAAVHEQLRQMATVARFALDPRSPGATVVEFR